MAGVSRQSQPDRNLTHIAVERPAYPVWVACLYFQPSSFSIFIEFNQSQFIRVQKRFHIKFAIPQDLKLEGSSRGFMCAPVSLRFNVEARVRQWATALSSKRKYNNQAGKGLQFRGIHTLLSTISRLPGSTNGINTDRLTPHSFSEKSNDSNPL
jgi:hypothetical protein